MVETSGLRHDRGWALWAGDRVLRGRDVPGLADVLVRVAGGGLQLRHASGRWVAATDSSLAERLATGPDPGWRLRASDQLAVPTNAPVHLVSVDAAAAADAPTGCDPHPRANLLVRLAAPGVERTWIGRRIVVGDAELAVDRLPGSCLGVYCTIVRPGVVTVGADVRLHA